ncbi:hypothetical protein [Hyphomicrobium sp. 99]|uniref:hypothetical protein n=1 Tax=Hyphomicrobium sp. 99 TaxID=1163419 RepID=UPI0005F7980D|nr:hypothetical protein [Hyphomicrobium sp. 99]
MAALVVTNAAFAYFAWDQWSKPIDISADLDGVEGGDKAVSEGGETTIAPPPRAGNLSQTTARPIFNSSRRPIEPKKITVAEPAPQSMVPAVSPDQLLLVGILHTGVGDDRALIRESSGAAGSWVFIGDSIEGWRVRAIRSEMAVIENEGKQYELRISYNTPITDNKVTAFNR